MSDFCLIPAEVDNFKKALKDQDIRLSDLVNLDHEVLVKKLEPYAGANAANVATVIEQKLILKNRVLGLQNAVNKLISEGKYSPEQQAKLKQAALDFKAKQEQRIFTPAEGESYLGGIVDKIVGEDNVPREVAAKIGDLTDKVRAAKELPATSSGFSNEYLKAKSELDQYILDQKPLGVPGSIGRSIQSYMGSNFLANPAIPLKALIGETVTGTMEHFIRRIGRLSLKSPNGVVAKELIHEAHQTAKQTGLNTPAMSNINDTHILGKGEKFKMANSSNAKGLPGLAEKGLRNAAKGYNKVVIGWGHQAGLNRFYRNAFFDHANFLSDKLAKSEGLRGEPRRMRAEQILRDAARIEPETKAGAITRAQSQRIAAKVTGTNETVIASAVLATKQALNDLTPGFPLGSFIVPIAKIPADLINNALSNAGWSLPFSMKDVFAGYAKAQSADQETKYEGAAQYFQGMQGVIRVVGSVGLGALIASQLTKDDFRKDTYGNQYVKWGNNWISMQYFVALSAVVGGMMEAKFKGQGGVQGVLNYAQGTVGGLQELPAISEVNQIIKDAQSPHATQLLEAYFKDFFTSRGVPSFAVNLTKDRPIQRLFFGATGLETDDQVTQDKQAAALKKSNVDWSTQANPSQRVLQFKSKVSPQVFQNANQEVNKQYSAWYQKTVNSANFKALSPTAQQSVLSKYKTVIEDKVLKDTGFTYKAQKQTAAEKAAIKSFKP